MQSKETFGFQHRCIILFGFCLVSLVSICTLARGQSDRHLFGVFIIVDGGFVLISFDGNLCYFEAFMVVLNVKFMFSLILNVPFYNNCLNYFYISRSFV